MIKYKAGDKVVYNKPKHSTHPSPNAKDLKPSELGEEYDYNIKKYWIVLTCTQNVVTICTPTQKILHFVPNDKNLRKASIWDRIFNRKEFPDFPTDLE